jgi:hypothetical protein
MFYVTWTVLLLCAFGAAFQFDFFLDNNFGTYFILLELFALSLVTLSILTSTILKKASSASTVTSPCSASHTHTLTQRLRTRTRVHDN